MGVVVEVVDVEKALQLSMATVSPAILLGTLLRLGDRHPLWVVQTNVWQVKGLSTQQSSQQA